MVVFHLISSFQRGGSERQLATILKYSNKSAILTKIICLKKAEKNYIKEYNLENDIIYLKTSGFYARLKEIGKILNEYEKVILWAWGSAEATYGLILSVKRGINFINGSIRHGVVLFNFHQIYRLIILHLSRTIVANSYAGLRANKLQRGIVIYNGIDKKFFTKPKKESTESRRELGAGSKIILLSSVGNLVPYKDYETILKALSIIKIKGIPFHYIAIGEGPERERIEDLLIRLNLSGNVSFPGSRSDIREILYESDIFIHSSRGEGCSNAILEAMSAGLPVIASDTGGTREIVSESNGRLFEFQNVEQLVEAILELISNKSLRENLGENSTKKALNDFSVERMMSYYYEIIEEVLG